MDNIVNIIKRFYTEIWTEGNQDTIREIIDDNYHPEDVTMPEKGPELLIKETAYFRSIFADLKYSILDYNIKSETEIWVNYSISGKQVNSAWGFPPTGNIATGKGFGIFTIKNGKITDQKRVYCLYDLFASSKAIPQFWELSDKLNS